MTNQNNNDGFFIQNILAGPLVICDPPHIKNGLYLDPIQPGETVNLSYYDTSVLSRSLALNNALNRGYAVILSENEYVEQNYIAEQREVAQNQELQERMKKIEASGNMFDAEQINLASGGNPHGDGSAEALLAQRNAINNQEAWVTAYNQAKANGIVKDPVTFKELVDSGRLSINSNNTARGQKVSLSEMQNVGAADQMTMTSTRATIAMPGSYNGFDNDGNIEEKGGVYTQKRQLSNFNATGMMTGAGNMGVADAPNQAAYAINQNIPQNRYAQDDGFVESIDLEQTDNDYDQQISMQNRQVSETLSPNARSPYIGQIPNMRRK